MDGAPLRYDGRCPICERAATFSAQYDWYRDHLICLSCRSVPRERALALVLTELRPEWRALRIHESSPIGRGISAKMRAEAPGYLETQFFPSEAPGTLVNGVRNENLEAQTFPDGAFDIIVSLDVMEHVNEPELCFKEFHRTLAPGGLKLFTAPTHKGRIETARRARFLPDGGVEHFGEPEYHGNPVDPMGSLVTFDYGYDLPDLIRRWSGLDVRTLRFQDKHHGLLGEFLEVYCCFKRD